MKYYHFRYKFRYIPTNIYNFRNVFLIFLYFIFPSVPLISHRTRFIPQLAAKQITAGIRRIWFMVMLKRASIIYRNTSIKIKSSFCFFFSKAENKLLWVGVSKSLIWNFSRNSVSTTCFTAPEKEIYWNIAGRWLTHLYSRILLCIMCACLCPYNEVLKFDLYTIYSQHE